MKKILISAILLFSLLPTTLANTAEEVISKHLKAHGGADKWAAVKNMTITGQYSGFSISKPFVFHLSRPHNLLFDHHLGDFEVKLGIHNDDFWWTFQSPMPGPMPELDQKVTRQWADFGTPFFTYKEDNCKVEYLGEKDLDGEPGLALKLTRPNGEEETWYLNSKTYVAFGRESIGSDFGRETRQFTFFSDYRDVNGLKIPFHTEITFNTRFRVMAIEKVEFNTDLDESMFAMPLPPGMNEIKHMLGDWKVKVSTQPRPGGDWVDQETTATIKPLAGKTMFLEEITVNFRGPRQIARTWAFDSSRDHYTVVSVDDTFGFPSILNGVMEEGSLRMDSIKSDTPRVTGRGNVHMAVTLSELSKDRFMIVRDFSQDEGKTWNTFSKAEYTRAK